MQRKNGNLDKIFSRGGRGIERVDLLGKEIKVREEVTQGLGVKQDLVATIRWVLDSLRSNPNLHLARVQ